MYAQYLEILIAACAEVFTEMSGLKVRQSCIKRGKQLQHTLSATTVIEYHHLKNELEGCFVLGFDCEIAAIRVANAIA